MNWASNAQWLGTTDRALPSQRERLVRQICRAEGLPEDHRDWVLQLLESLPDGSTVCHGDLHPENILVAGGRAVVIDWTNATRGNPLADVARSCLMLKSPYTPPGPLLRVAVSLLRRTIRHTYLRLYLRLTEADEQEMLLWKIPVAAARLVDKVPGEREWLLELITRSLAHMRKSR